MRRFETFLRLLKFTTKNVSKRLKMSQKVSKVLDISVKILQIQKFI